MFKIKSKKKNTQKIQNSIEQTQTSTKFTGIGRGAMEEWISSADRSHTTCAHSCNRENGKSVDNSVINNGLTISMKNLSQHATKWKNVFAAEKVVVWTKELIKCTIKWHGN